MRMTLTKVQMESVKVSIEDDGWANGFIKVFEILIAPRKWEEVTEIDGTDYGIPEVQWKEICKALIEDGGVNAGLTWMNQGPSGFSDDS